MHARGLRIELYAPEKTLRTANTAATLSLAPPPPRVRDNDSPPCRLAVTAAGDVLAGACVCVEVALAASNVSRKGPAPLFSPSRRVLDLPRYLLPLVYPRACSGFSAGWCLSGLISSRAGSEVCNSRKKNTRTTRHSGEGARRGIFAVVDAMLRGLTQRDFMFLGRD